MKTRYLAMGGALLLSQALFACSKEKEPETPASAETGPTATETARSGEVGAEKGTNTFRFAPRAGSFVQTTRETRTTTAPGTPLANTMESEYVWDVVVNPQGAATTYRAQLQSVRVMQNGQLLLSRVPQQNQIEAQVDSRGQVTDVTGVDSLASGLTDQLSPEQQAAAAAALQESSREALTHRFQLTVRDLIGRPTKLGSSWQVQAPPGSPVTGKTMQVRGEEVCGNERCLRVESTYQIDNQAIRAELQGEMVGQVTDPEGETHDVTLGDITVQAKDSILVEPNTLFAHEARFEQTVTLAMEREGQRTPITITEVRDISARRR